MAQRINGQFAQSLAAQVRVGGQQAEGGARFGQGLLVGLLQP